MIVFVIAEVYYIEDYHRAESVVKVSFDREVAEKWVEKKLEEDAAARKAVARYREIRTEWDVRNPFKFNESKPPNPPKWPPGVGKKNISPEMKAVRDAAQALLDDYHARYGAAHTAHNHAREAHLYRIWAEERWVETIECLPIHDFSEPSEYLITGMTVLTADDLLKGNTA